MVHVSLLRESKLDRTLHTESIIDYARLLDSEYSKQVETHSSALGTPAATGCMASRGIEELTPRRDLGHARLFGFQCACGL